MNVQQYLHPTSTVKKQNCLSLNLWYTLFLVLLFRTFCVNLFKVNNFAFRHASYYSCFFLIFVLCGSKSDTNTRAWTTEICSCSLHHFEGHRVNETASIVMESSCQNLKFLWLNQTTCFNVHLLQYTKRLQKHKFSRSHQFFISKLGRGF